MVDVVLWVLVLLGLVFDENFFWLNISVCIGSFGCVYLVVDVWVDVVWLLNVELVGYWYFVGCEWVCGSLLVGEVLVVIGGGYW